MIDDICIAGIILAAWLVFLGWILVRVFKVIRIDFGYEPPAKGSPRKKRR